ncbi:MAG: hypothetical protein DMF90_24990, partial [Acidobacteria bacterium]
MALEHRTGLVAGQLHGKVFDPYTRGKHWGRSSTMTREETRSGCVGLAFLEPRVAKKRVGSEASCEAEPKVIVAEGRIELAAQR